jgi:hypothetical protein
VANLARLKWLRRRIGVNEQPFAPLPERPRSHTRFHRIADEIRALELKLVSHLGDINLPLSAASESARPKGEW